MSTKPGLLAIVFYFVTFFVACSPAGRSLSTAGGGNTSAAPPASAAGSLDTGGQGSTGGGGGLACFKTTSEKNQMVNSNGLIPMENRSKILKLQTLDYFEVIRTKGFIQPATGEDAKTFLNRVIKTKIEPVNAIFAHRLEKALDLIKIKTWSPQRSLNLIFDWGEEDDAYLRFLRENNPECAPIQIAVRHSIPKPGLHPIVSVEVDSDYFDRLATLNPGAEGTINQAALYLHEAIYLLGSMLGQNTSEGTRQLVGILLSQGTYDSLNELSPAAKAVVFRADLGKAGFNQYAKLFADDYPSKSNKTSHIADYDSLSKKRYTLVKAWSKLPHPDIEAKDSDEIFDDFWDYMTLLIFNYKSDGSNGELETYLRQNLPPMLTPGEGFLVVATEAMVRGRINNYDVFMAPEEEDSKDFSTVCAAAKEWINAEDEKDLNQTLNQTIVYCTSAIKK